MNAVCIVTGGAGFIGSHLVEYLLDQNQMVIAIDDLSSGNKENLQKAFESSNFEFIERDAGHASLADIYAKAEYIFHHAAIPSVPRSFEAAIACHDSNLSLTLKILEAVRGSSRLKNLVFASSSAVYADDRQLPKAEDSRFEPKSPYALQKLSSEYYAQIYAATFKVPSVSLRYFNVFGLRQSPFSEYSAVIPKFIYALKKNLPLTIFGDGLQKRDFVHVRDVVRANWLAALKAKPGSIYNIGSGSDHNLLQLAQFLQKIAGTDVQINYQPARKGDIRDSYADISKAQKDLEFYCDFSLEVGLEQTWSKTV